MSVRKFLYMLSLGREHSIIQQKEAKKKTIIDAYEKIKSNLEAESQKVLNVTENTSPHGILRRPDSILSEPDLYIDPYHLETQVSGKTDKEIRTELEKEGFSPKQIEKLITKYGVTEGDILLEIFYDAVEKLEETPEPKAEANAKFREFFNRERSVRFLQKAPIQEFVPEEPPEKVGKDMVLTSRALTNYLESLSNPKEYTSSVTFDRTLDIEIFKFMDPPSKLGEYATPESLAVSKLRTIIKKGLTLKLIDIREKKAHLEKYIREQEPLVKSFGSTQLYSVKNFKFYLKHLNLLSQVMYNMLELTRNSLQLLLNLRMFSLSDDIKQIIRDRINELDTYIEKSEPSRQRAPGSNLFLNDFGYFDETTQKLIDINQDCLDVYANIRTIYGPILASQGGQRKREEDIKTVAFELLEQNILLFNIEVDAYKFHREHVNELFTGINQFISIVTSREKSGKSLPEQANIPISFGEKTLAQLGGISELIRQTKSSTTSLPISLDELRLLEKVEQRAVAASAPAKTVSSAPKLSDIKGFLDLILFLCKIIVVVIMFIINCIKIILVVPFNSENGFNLVRDNTEYFELLNTKRRLNVALNNIDIVGDLTDKGIDNLQEALTRELKIKSLQSTYAKEVNASPWAQNPAHSGGARKLTKKRRKKSAKTKNKRKRKNSLKRKNNSKSKSNSKHSRRKRKQLPK